MRKILIILCLAGGFIAFGDSSTEVTVKIKNTTTESQSSSKRRYPKYKTVKNLLNSYAKAWSAEDYRLMYHLLSKSTREEWTYSRFKRLLEADKETNGGLNKFGSMKQTADNGGTESWTITLVYKNSSARSKTIRAILVKDGDHWFVKDGGLLPPDYSIFDR